MLDLAHVHQIYICFLLFHNNQRLRYGSTPGTVKLWESPQQSWGFIDDYYIVVAPAPYGCRPGS